MKKLICLILTIFFFLKIQAAVVTWVAGTTGDWNVATNWDSNSIPAAADEVIITDGNVTIPDGYDALATRVEISNIGTLTINPNASLTLDGAEDSNAFESFGMLNCRGDLIIDHVTYSGNDSELGNGILNKGNILVTKSGRILLNDIAKSGIRNNNLSVVFENKGFIKVTTAFTGRIGIDCNNTNFLNTGDIEIFAGSLSGLSANTGNFINKGSISIDSPGTYGMLITGAFTNKGAGSISIKNTFIGIIVDNDGDFKNNASLLIENIADKGLENNAIFTNGVNGILTIDQIVQLGISNSISMINRGVINIERIIDGNGITNFGSIENKALGSIVLKRIDKSGIENRSEGTVKNFGTIRFQSVFMSASPGSIGIYNKGDFKNKTNSFILIQDTLNAGIFNFNPNALFVNDGFIDISPLSSTSTGISVVEGEFRNNRNGLIDVNLSAQIGLEVSEGAIFLNDGFATFQGCESEGVNISGTVINKYFFNCRINDRGMLINPTGEFRNTAGALNIEFNTGTGLENQGLFTNKVEARVDITDPIDNTGTFKNKGFLFSDYDGLNSNSGTMKNTGAIQDIFEQVLPLIDNKSVIATQLNGTIEVGVPYPDALNLGNQTNFVVDGWFLSTSATMSAGTYDQTTNVFTPDSAAIGQTTLFVQVTLTDGPVTGFLRVVLENEVVDNGGSSMMIGNENAKPANSKGSNNLLEGFSKIIIAPNPAKDYVNIILESAMEEATQICIYNTIGQSKQSIPVSGLEAGIFRIDLENQLTDGVYLLEIRAKNGIISQDRILVMGQ